MSKNLGKNSIWVQNFGPLEKVSLPQERPFTNNQLLQGRSIKSRLVPPPIYCLSQNWYVCYNNHNLNNLTTKTIDIGTFELFFRLSY